MSRRMERARSKATRSKLRPSSLPSGVRTKAETSSAMGGAVEGVKRTDGCGTGGIAVVEAVSLSKRNSGHGEISATRFRHAKEIGLWLLKPDGDCRP